MTDRAPVNIGHARGSPRDGSILVVVLMLAGLIAALASAAAETQRASYAAGLAYADGLRAESAMRSAIERTVAHGAIGPSGCVRSQRFGTCCRVEAGRV